MYSVYRLKNTNYQIISDLLIKASSNSSITASFSVGFQDIDALLEINKQTSLHKKKKSFLRREL